jgi:hypothetical protein
MKAHLTSDFESGNGGSTGLPFKSMAAAFNCSLSAQRENKNEAGESAAFRSSGASDTTGNIFEIHPLGREILVKRPSEEIGATLVARASATANPAAMPPRITPEAVNLRDWIIGRCNPILAKVVTRMVCPAHATRAPSSSRGMFLEAPTTVSVVCTPDIAGTLCKALSWPSERYQIIMLLQELERLSLSESARRSGLTISAVKASHLRARQKVVKCSRRQFRPRRRACR